MINVLMASIKVSRQGLIQIKSAIADRGWKMSDDRWSLAASRILEPSKNWEELGLYANGCSKSSRERLLEGTPIHERAFKAFCQALAIDPDEVAQFDIKEVHPVQTLELDGSNTPTEQAIFQDFEQANDTSFHGMEEEMDSDTSFTLETALQTLDNIIVRHQGKYLKDIEIKIFRGAWKGQTYEKIAEITGYSFEYICGDVGYNLWKDLSIALDEKVTKTNFKAAIKREWQRNSQANCNQNKIRSNSATENLTFPEGPVALGSPLYLQRSNCESICYETIAKPASLIRIKGVKWMGKTSLVNRILEQARSQGQKTVYLDFGSIERSIIQDLDRLLSWLCVMVSRQLELDNRVREYWDTDILGSNDNCTVYFEEYILAQTKGDLVFALDNIDKLFAYTGVVEDFFSMLRSWHEKGKVYPCWSRLKLILAHSTEVYIRLNIDRSPFNTGVPILLEEFTYMQVQALASLYQLSWKKNQISQLMDLIGGHPYLIRLAMYHIKSTRITVKQFVKEALSETGIYSSLLLRLLSIIKQSPELVSAFTKVVGSDVPIELNPLHIYQLHSIGLVRQQDNLVFPRCKLYQVYFNRVFTA